MVAAALLSDGSGVGGGGGGTRSTTRVFAVVVFRRPVRSLSLKLSSALKFDSISAIAVFMHSVGSITDGCSKVPLNLEIPIQNEQTYKHKEEYEHSKNEARQILGRSNKVAYMTA